MTPLDTVWLAGLLEGEATFDLHRGRYPRIRVSMTDRDTITRVAGLLGSTVRPILRPPPCSGLWASEVSGVRAAVLMAELLPFMGSRRSGAILAALGGYTAYLSTRRRDAAVRINSAWRNSLRPLTGSLPADPEPTEGS